MNEHVTLSIIMPCFNVAETIARALNSIFMQTVDFQYEVIIIDDASTDNGLELYKEYQKVHPEIRIIQHESNKGNAHSFYDGLSASRGNYFCVLDGDDYYTIHDKLQRQIDFFRTDIKQEYVAAAHYHILDLGNGQINIPPTFPFTEYNYADFLTQNGGYFHTSTYMFRNIFRGNVPQYFKEKIYRGDTPRTTFHLMFSNGKSKILNFVGSVYTFTNQGIWSSLQEKQQFEYQIHYLSEHKKRVTTKFERDSIDNLIMTNRAKSVIGKNQVRRYEGIDLDSALARTRTLASRYAYREKDFVLNGLYFSEYVDSLCASIGYIYLLQHEDVRQRETNEDQVAVVLGEVRASGGGIFHEVTELIEMYRDFHVTLFVTNMKEVPPDGLERLSTYPNLEIICPPMESMGKLQYLAEAYHRVSPAKAYVYTSHNDTYAQALMQDGPCKNICIFSFDHGYLCGISNPNYDFYIAKRPIDYEMLRKKFGDKAIYIPTWNADMGTGKEAYVPFGGHTRLITACAAARYYKVDGAEPYSYLDCIVSLLARTKGKHYHIGEIPDDTQREIYATLKKNGIPKESFVHIPWSQDIAATLLENKVDVFIEPFPVVSYKISLEVYSGGIPVIVYNGFRRMNITDFIYDQPLNWSSKKEFLDLLCSVDAQTLSAHGKRAREYYLQNHEISLLRPFFLKEKEFCTPTPQYATDAAFHEIRDFYRLFGSSARIDLMTMAASSIPQETSIIKDCSASQKAKNLKDLLKRWDRKLRNKQSAMRDAGKNKLLTKSILLLSPYTIYLKLTEGKAKNKQYDLKAVQHDMAALKYYLRTINSEMAGLRSSTASSLADLDVQQKDIAEVLSSEIAGLNNGVERVIEQHKDISGAHGSNLAKIGNAVKEIADTQCIQLRNERMSESALIMSTAKTIRRTSMEHMDYHLTEHCNLNCRGCSTYSPMAKEKFANPEDFRVDLQQLYELIGDSVQQIHLLGGEPLLHPQINEFTVICRSIFTEARIDYTTNGLLIYNMADDFWKTLRECDVAIKYSKYPINFDYDKMIAYIQEKGVRVFTAGGSEGIKSFRRIPLNAKGTFNMHQSYIQCPYTDCAQLRNGRLYRCPTCGFSDILNSAIPGEASENKFQVSTGDYIDLFNTKSRDEVFDFLSSATPFCSYCDMMHIDGDVKWCTSSRDIREWIDE